MCTDLLWEDHPAVLKWLPGMPSLTTLKTGGKEGKNHKYPLIQYENLGHNHRQEKRRLRYSYPLVYLDYKQEERRLRSNILLVPGP